MQIWKKIGDSFGLSGENAAKYFKSLREKYLRIKKDIAKYENSGAAANHKEKWHLFDLLKFLDEVTRPRKTLSNAIRSNEVSEGTTKYSDVLGDIENLSQDSDASPVFEDDGYQADAVNIELNDDITHEVEGNKSVARATLQKKPMSQTTKTLRGTPNTHLAAKKRKIDEQMADTLQSIAESINKGPSSDYVSAFCTQIEQEMLNMTSEVMEEFKDEVIEVLLKKRKLRSHSAQ